MLSKLLVGVTSALLVSIIAAPSARAFDCAAAHTPLELAICGNPALKAADDALVGSYVAALKRTTGVNHDLLIETQRRWLKERDQCMSRPSPKRSGCIARATSLREKSIEETFAKDDKPLLLDEPGSEPTGDNPKDIPDLTCSIPADTQPGRKRKREASRNPACGDPVLLSALVNLRDAYVKGLAARSPKERPAYALIARPLIDAMSGCEANDVFDRSCALMSANANLQTLMAFDGSGSQQTGRLNFFYRRRAAADGYDIHSVYAKFAQPRDAAERLFNSLIIDATWQDALLSPYDEENKRTTKEGRTLESFADVTSIRDRAGLLSFAVSTWECCGAHGSGDVSYTNIVRKTGTLFDPAATFRVADLAESCWRSWSGNKDFLLLTETKQDPDEVKLDNEFKAKLAQLMSGQRYWWFSDMHVELAFGSMGAYAAGPSGCTLTYDDLEKALKPGEVIP